MFSEDFEFVFGPDWKNKLNIPRGFSVNEKNETWHTKWVRHLYLAKNGKIEPFRISSGYGVGGYDQAEISIKFAQCMEKRLIKAGARPEDVRFVLSSGGSYPNARTTPSHPYGGKIMIEAFCYYPSYRLW